MYKPLAGLEINFGETDYSIDEDGTLSTEIRLQFRNNQNPFTITLSAVSINTTEELDLGFFINSDDISFISRATSGTYKYVLLPICTYIIWEESQWRF